MDFEYTLTAGGKLLAVPSKQNDIFVFDPAVSRFVSFEGNIYELFGSKSITEAEAMRITSGVTPGIENEPNK